MKDNKLIAEFMGINVVTEDDIRANKNPTISSYEGDLEEDLKYHYSWDWLMPVIKKIEAKNYWFNRLDGNVTLVNDKGIIISTPMSDGGIDMYYQTVVEFIKRTKKST